MNIILTIISAALCFSFLLIVERLFKRDGLIVWISVATVTANILVCKNINLFGLTATLGNIMFGSNFLALDILCEKYNTKDARKAVILGVFSSVLFLSATQIGLLFIPSPDDIVHDSMKVLFSINLRVTIASEVMYLCSNLFDVFLFEKIRDKIGALWVRNNVSTIVSNCGENFFFVFLAFAGIYDVKTMLSIALTTCLIEALVALFDTPFIYLATRENR